MKIKKSWKIILGLLIALILFGYLFFIANYYPVKRDLKHRPDFFGVTFSKKFCDLLGIDWRETYQAMLDELKVKYIRIPVYWDEIEKNEGTFDFTDNDYLLDIGEQQGAKFVVVVGRRSPRWPECHAPEWINEKSSADVQAATLEMIKTVVERYKNRGSIEYWQIENEAFLGTFGVCPPLDQEFLKKEFALVRSLDNRQIIITGSGELGFWKKEAKIGDIFGSTLYRVVYDRRLGYLKYPLPTAYYRLKGWLVGLTPERLMIMELQAEPWAPKGVITDLTRAEIDKTMSIEQFKKNLQYTINLNFSRNYIWGVEWWYWEKKYGNPEYWQIAETLFK
jgi:hypothetical protein